MVDRDHAPCASSKADWIVNNPTGPQPHTATVSPGSISALTGGVPSGWQDVREEQDIVVGKIVGDDDRADVGIGHTHIVRLPAGTQPPVRWAYPNAPPIACPISSSDASRVSDGLLLSQALNCFSQKKQEPQFIVKGTTTRCPF